MRWLLLALLFCLSHPAAAWFPHGASTTSAPAYTGPCDIVTCPTAHSVTRSLRSAYTGPLFQLYNGVTTLDVGQVARTHAVDLSTYGNFCSNGNSTTQTVNGIAVLVSSSCVFGIFYDHTANANNLIPAVFLTTAFDCSGGTAYKCAVPFMIEVATGLPFINTTGMQNYTLSGDLPANGITPGHQSISVVEVGSGPAVAICCGSYGIYHKYNAGIGLDPSDFAVALSYGNATFNCGATSTTHSLEIDGEGCITGLFADYGTTQISTIMVIAYSASTDKVSGWVNGTLKFGPTTSNSAPRLNLTSIHLGSGGDGTTPAPTPFREGFMVNGDITANIAALEANITAFYGSLSFP